MWIEQHMHIHTEHPQLVQNVAAEPVRCPRSPTPNITRSGASSEDVIVPAATEHVKIDIARDLLFSAG
jgi:hypothetical protein